MKKVSDDEIGRHVQRAIAEMELYDTQDVRDNREKALRLYEGRMPEVEPDDPDSSRAVSYDVRDAVDFIMPQIMRIFFGGHKVFHYTPTHQRFRDQVSEADDYVNDEVLEENDAYEVFYDGFHDALLQQNGIFKIFWDDTPIYEIVERDNVSEIDLESLMDDENIEVLSHEENKIMVEDDLGVPGEEIEVTVYSIRMKVKVKDGATKVISIPREEFLITPGARDIDSAKACAHRRRVMRGTLLDEGHDRDDIDKLSNYNYDYDEEEQIRDQYDVITNSDYDDWATQEVEVFECYIKMDHDGDDVASELRVLSGGENQPVLDWEVWDDERPFADLAPERRAHRWTGRSIADHIMDIQEIKTVILRQTLDNVYDNNEPMTAVHKQMVSNIEAVVNKERGTTILTKTDPRNVIHQLQPQFIAREALEMLAYMDNMSQKRIGAAKDTPALDMDSLQRQTEFATSAAMSAAYTKVEYIARNMAMGGMKRIAKKLYNVVRNNVPPGEYEFRGESRSVNPSGWPATIRCHVNVGLGTGTREKDLSMLTMILQMQREIFASLSPETQVWADMFVSIRATLIKIVEAANLQNAEEYFPPVGDEDIQMIRQAAAQEGQNSDAAIVLEAEKTKAQATVQSAQIRAQSDQQKSQKDGMIKTAELESGRDIKARELAIEEEKIAQGWEKLKIEREKMNVDANIKDRQTRLQVAQTYGTDENDDEPVATSRDMMGIMGKLVQSIDALNSQINGPREIVYDGDQIIGVKVNGELKTAERNEDDNIVRLN